MTIAGSFFNAFVVPAITMALAGGNNLRGIDKLREEISLMRQDIEAVNNTGRDPYTGGKYGQNR